MALHITTLWDAPLELGILYKQLGQKLAPNLLATQTPQETESTEDSTPKTQENESEKILAPDFTVYDEYYGPFCSSKPELEQHHSG